MARWFLVRHGRTEFNRNGRVQGQSQVPLDEEGLAQAHVVGRLLGHRDPRDGLAGGSAVAGDLAFLHLGPKLGQNPPGVVAELLGAELVGRVGPQRRTDHRPTGRQRPPRPPDVQRRNMPMPDILLMHRIERCLLQGKGNFDEAFVISHGFAALLFFLVMAGMTVVAILVAPTLIVMVGEDEGLVPSLRKTVRFTRGSFWTYIGLGILLALIAVALGFVPYVGQYLSFLMGAIGNIAMIDIYNSCKQISEL